MSSITPFLWFVNEAEDAANLYTSIVKRSKVVNVNRANGQTMAAIFDLDGQRVIALNGRPEPGFTDAFSFLISCDTQAEIDDLWAKLTANGGSPGRCGWLKDKFGVSWQITPASLPELLSGGGDPDRAGRVMEAMLAMTKLDLRELQNAYDGAVVSR